MPLLLGVAPFGLVTGVAMAAAGIPALAAIAMSVLVFAGASMLAAAQLLAAHAPVAVIVATAFVVNLRFAMYSASMRAHFAHLPLAQRALVALLLADNPYALSASRFARHPDRPGKLAYYLGVSLPVWLVWQATVAVGVLAGARLPAAWKLEFAAPLAFIAISVPLLSASPMLAAALVAGAVAVLAHGLPLRLGLLTAAAAGIGAGLLVESLGARRRA
ncbi:MAG: AzlC family ABC transporter permease [Burkholderiales bacterium]|nr:AzlC family ABC transporter permease [Burkholderiales bacterium]